MNIQIVGTKKCKDTAKAQRFFKERNIKFQFIDLKLKNLSKGELTKIANKFGLENLIDRNGKEYKKNNLKYMKFDLENKLLENSLLLKTPIIINGKDITLGIQTEIWKNWL
jgi:arsenate reductase-like glutaredoxin family protein